MSDSHSNANQRAAELRLERDRRLEAWRNQPVAAWLHQSAARRALAFAPAITIVLGIAAAVTSQETLGLVLLGLALVIGAAGTVLLRRASSLLDSAPPGMLDEREVAERNRAYRRAFQLALGIVGLLWLLAVIDGFLPVPNRVLDGFAWVFLTLTAFVSMSMIPAAALLWNARFTPNEDE